MRSTLKKKHPTIGCCGIDCGLCTRYYTEGTSRCPGCAGKSFAEKHPSCSIITCCLGEKNLETCADCEDFLCTRMRNWDSADSFVTHRRCISNLENIREKGLSAFIAQQETRMRLLKELLEGYDDGRSKSFYCLAATLLPAHELKAAIEEVGRGASAPRDKKLTARLLREAFTRIAAEKGVELSYRRA